jgi:hypothetical protein
MLVAMAIAWMAPGLVDPPIEPQSTSALIDPALMQAVYDSDPIAVRRACHALDARGESDDAKGIALCMAITTGDEAIVAELLRDRAPLTYRTIKGKSPFDLAAESPNGTRIGEMLRAAVATITAPGSARHR